MENNPDYSPKLKLIIKDLINSCGLKNVLVALIDVIAERTGTNDEYMIKLFLNLSATLHDYENRYIVNGKDTRFD
jgi:hypothetical protein